MQKYGIKGPHNLSSNLCNLWITDVNLCISQMSQDQRFDAFLKYQDIKHHENRPNKGLTSNMKSKRYVGVKVSCPTPISQVCSLDTDKRSLMVTRVYSSHGVQSV